MVTPGPPRTVTILGSTGSIGCSTVDLIRRQPDRYKAVVLTANTNAGLLAEQARLLGAGFAVIADPSRYRALADALDGTGIECAAGAEALVEAACRQSDWVMAGIVGAAGLAPTLAAVSRGAIVGLANKECLVCAGSLFMREVEASGATLLPVDSEHNAIYQVFASDAPDSIEKIVLTASGGPFRTWSMADIARATPKQAVAHPNWDMGAKISVDSATMMNKGLELIEAHHLFGLPADRIEIIVHPQSIVHSMVAYVDGSVLAQLGTPDMRIPISYALAWPERMKTPSERLDLSAVGSLDFEAPDPDRFPALRLARESLIAGGAAPTVLNAANEEAVERFLDGRLGFLDIARIVEGVLEAFSGAEVGSLADVREADRLARERARALMEPAPARA
ncbi:MAG: 1-deoxy-D-xylulose-5-phosphate reductoisomerase [Defluviicoccus sp.]|nr:1-deoxy-D-xylulose-5-phosphate reductoisomerase [Defluviicoccus sp.]MDE0279354.1 1-deoxy-D-xylulose-5-phosphate reductoisomerase [Defluviicoccus sp.]